MNNNLEQGERDSVEYDLCILSFNSRPIPQVQPNCETYCAQAQDFRLVPELRLSTDISTIIHTSAEPVLADPSISKLSIPTP